MHADALLRRHLSAFIISGLLFLSGAYLFMKNDRELDPDYRKNWWTLSFSDPASLSSMDFIIVNHTPSESFTYARLRGKDILETHIVAVPRRSEKTIQQDPKLGQEEEIRVWPTDQPEDIFSIYRE